MNRFSSTETDLISKALVKAQASAETVTKDSINPHFKSPYASLAAVITASQKVLADCDLSVVGEVRGNEWISTIRHASGQWIELSYPFVVTNNTMQGIGSAQSYARRYSLLAILNLSTADDDGAEASKHEPTDEQTLAPAITEKQRARLFAIAKANGYSKQEIKDLLMQMFNIDTTERLNWIDYGTLCKRIENLPKSATRS